MTTAPYLVKVLWMAEHAPGWELETTHPGFASPIEAALFANGFEDHSPAQLEVHRGAVRIDLWSAFSPSPGDQSDRAERTARLANGIALSWSADDHPSRDGEGIRAQPAIAGLTLSVWRLRQHAEAVVDGIELVGDADFEIQPHVAPRDLAAHGLDGTWLPHGYDVMGPEGHVEVVIDFDELTGNLTVEVSDRNPRDLETVDPALTIVPKA
jgi:hypothetical protein